MKLTIKDFFGKSDHIRRKLRILSNLLNKFLMENLILCAVISFLSQGKNIVPT